MEYFKRVPLAEKVYYKIYENGSSG